MSFDAAYQLKSVADYETGADSHVTVEAARSAHETARRFVQCVVGLLPADDPI